MKKRLYIFITIIIIFIIIVFLVRILDTWKISRLNNSIKEKYYATNDRDKDIKTLSDINNLEQKNKILTPSTDKDLEDNKNDINKKFIELLKTNKEIVGWINVPNTKVDYPIVKTSNNNFYLNHNILKKEDSSGAIFMDFRNDIEIMDKNTILYGHNMKNGTMFKGLMKYKDEDFLKENKIISFSTLYEDIKWEIFSAYVTDTNFYYIQVNFKNSYEYESFLNNIKGKSMFDTSIDLNSSDNILTLSTCSYEFDDARFVIHAKRVN